MTCHSTNVQIDDDDDTSGVHEQVDIVRVLFFGCVLRLFCILQHWESFLSQAYFKQIYQTTRLASPISSRYEAESSCVYIPVKMPSDHVHKKMTYHQVQHPVVPHFP